MLKKSDLSNLKLQLKTLSDSNTLIQINVLDLIQ